MLPAGHQQSASSVLYITSCKHSLVLLRMGPKHVELIEVIDKIIIVASIWLFILLDTTTMLIIFPPQWEGGKKWTSWSSLLGMVEV